ncbi:MULTISPECIES: sugar ABC transporter ATP-binding protein [unclassified Microbacterium]|uniref:sugar ABC transporter ATP-binding protein n=1 Tax=unclassified Microbacterium TaxID=2609290 RepID=UPI001AEEDF69|nr:MULTISPECIES: sugar ABC transporter ATP-binding protein [unclassified Microbacterium]QYM63804.1 sugar ABC transporter ATP-binding protein [Microbacterium sp. Se5.02b]
MMAIDEPVAEVIGASKHYGPVVALDDVSFTIRRGEVRALLGKNGAGKSTLIRLLSGAEAPDSGDVVLGGERLGAGGVEGAHRLGVRTVYQELSLIGSMSVAENMFMGRWPSAAGALSYRRMHAATRDALARLDLDIEPGQAVDDLSVADQQLVEIARAIHDQPRLLILDEPTSSLAAAEVGRVLDAVQTIAASGVAVLYVSHRLNEIRQVADTASVMRDGRLIDTRPLADVDTREVVHMMIGNAVEQFAPVAEAPTELGEVVLDVSDIHDAPFLHGVSLSVRKGEVLGIAGVLGSGRTELLKIVNGVTAPASGTVRVHGRDLTGRGHRIALRSGVGMTPENRKQDGIFPQLGVDENMLVSDWRAVSAGGFTSPRKMAASATALIERLRIKTSSARAEIDTLSGGNQQKAIIGRWLHAESDILLLDEPTRGVDVEAKAQIYALIRELAAAGKSIVFVSSEMEELPSVCDRVVVLRGGRIVEEHRAPNIDIDAILSSAIAEH